MKLEARRDFYGTIISLRIRKIFLHLPSCPKELHLSQQELLLVFIISLKSIGAAAKHSGTSTLRIG